MLRIDFHVHTSERSDCAKSPQREQIESAIDAGLQAIAITDHFQLVPAAELAAINRRYAPFQILSGIEITADEEDWLVLGLANPVLESENWSYPRLHQFVRSQGGTIILAHPYRFAPLIHVDLVRYPPDAIEIRSNNIHIDLVQKIEDLARSLGLPTACDSDAHVSSAIGRYFNRFDDQYSTQAKILAALRSGDFTHCNEIEKKTAAF